jgi:hypothetical protein
MKVHKLSPSDFAFLWEQCKRCFYLKVIHRLRQPSMPMAKIFKRIEALQMEFYEGKPATEVSADLPAGVIRCGERWVESEVIQPPGREAGCYILGKTDSLIEFDNGSWAVVDFKTTATRGEHIPLYARQLHAYAYALERPARPPRSMKQEPPRLSPITKLGLLCFEPTELSQPDSGRHAYQGEVRWIEMERDESAFLEFVGEIVDLLEGTIPEPRPDCNWCKYGMQLADRELIATPPKAPAGEPACPDCGSAMVRRDGRYGPFLSCARYPACRGTRDLAGR